MIKSPCKGCYKYESGFPYCFDTCDLLKEIQAHNKKLPFTPYNCNTYIPEVNHSFIKVSHKQPALS